MYLKDFFVFLERIALHDIEKRVFLCVSILSSHPRNNFLSECIIRRYRVRRFQNLRKFTQLGKQSKMKFFDLMQSEIVGRGCSRLENETMHYE